MQAEDFLEECMEEWCFDAVIFPTVHVAELFLDFSEEGRVFYELRQGPFEDHIDGVCSP